MRRFGQRFFLLQQRDLFFEFRQNFWPDFFHRQKRLRQQQTRGNILRTIETLLDVAVYDFASAANKIGLDSIHASATHRQKLFQPQ